MKIAIMYYVDTGLLHVRFNVFMELCCIILMNIVFAQSLQIMTRNIGKSLPIFKG